MSKREKKSMSTACNRIGNSFKTIAFLAAVLPLRSACAEQKSVFLYPNDNAYASDKILNRPYLQRRFIRDVWDTGAINDEFLDYMYNFDVPDQTPEELFNAATWATDAEEKKQDFQSARADAAQEIELTADLGTVLFPDLDANAQYFINQVDQADLDFTNVMLDYESKREMVREADAMVDFDQSRTGLALIDLLYARIGASEKKADAAVDDALFEKAEEPTDKFAVSGDLSQTETVAAKIKKHYDDLMFGLKNADLKDWLIVLDVGNQDENRWEKAFLGLDTSDISATIQKKSEKHAMEGEK